MQRSKEYIPKEISSCLVQLIFNNDDMINQTSIQWFSHHLEVNFNLHILGIVEYPDGIYLVD